MTSLRIGTRGSALALWQARHVRELLLAAHGGLEIALEVIKTRGDKMLEGALSKIGGKGIFTGEIEEALLAGRVDLAVHSLKDLPTEQPAGLTLAAIHRREDPADALISRDNRPLGQLPRGATVLTGSLRRQVQLRHCRGDLKVQALRGNVNTRLRKFEESNADAVVLAAAGLVRLGLGDRITQRLDPAEFLPACGQGALAVEIRADNARLAELCQPLDHMETRQAAAAERALLSAMGGGCQVPLGAYGRFERPGELTLTGMVANLDASQFLRQEVAGPAGDAEAAVQLGIQLGQILKSMGAERIIGEVLSQTTPAGEGGAA